jgi:hypothetical protein
MAELQIGSVIPIMECRQFPEYCWEDMSFQNSTYLQIKKILS